jgi:hypothetical protein
MNHTTSNAGSVMNQCERFTAHLVFNSKVLGSIPQISNSQRRSEQDLC